jgi:hypothetical protein
LLASSGINHRLKCVRFDKFINLDEIDTGRLQFLYLSFCDRWRTVDHAYLRAAFAVINDKAAIRQRAAKEDTGRVATQFTSTVKLWRYLCKQCAGIPETGNAIIEE